MKCTNCGKEYDQEYHHCPWCGERQNASPYVDSTIKLSPPPKKKKSIVAITFTVLGIAMLAIVAYDMAFHPLPPADSYSSASTIDYFLFDIPEGVSFGMKEGDLRNKLGGEFYEYGSLIYRTERLDFLSAPSEIPFSAYSYRQIFGFSNSNKLEYISYQFDCESKPYDDAVKFMTYITSFKGSTTGPLTVTWTNTKYKNDEYSRNRAFRDGHCTAECQWDMGDYVITLHIDDDFNLDYSLKQ